MTIVAKGYIVKCAAGCGSDVEEHTVGQNNMCKVCVNNFAFEFATGKLIQIDTRRNKMSSLGVALPREIERVQELIKQYESVPMGHIAASMMKADIKKAHDAMMIGDLVAMIAVYKELQGYE